jgi:crotonobetainyl-CoA:carnitine CoA-transferase CaiB-like acyl-CoA transferase
MLPLKGIKILDLTTLSGYCGMELADYGAEVIKIESPCGGDPLRRLAPLKNGASSHHAFRDRGKKSVTLDLRHPEGKEIFKKLAAAADAVLENYPPGTLEALGLGFEDISDINPSIVYGRITAYGSTGTETHVPQSDLLAQAKTGAMHVTGFPEAPPTRIGFPISERYASSFLSVAVCVAIYHAKATGEGQIVETSLCGALVSVTEDKVITYGADHVDPPRTGNAHPRINPYDILKCKDGYIALSLSPEQWERFCDAYDREEWKVRYGSNAKRNLNYMSDLRVKMEELWSEFTMQEIYDVCNGILIPVTMCVTTKEALQEPQLHLRNMAITVKDAGVGDLEMPGKPIKFVGETEEALCKAPNLGEHNAEIYGVVGIAAAKLEQLQHEGVI